ncbi:MAG: hypothetical protein Q7S28_00470 [bacterium]|nr:hypothetical protein [bacterium]
MLLAAIIFFEALKNLGLGLLGFILAILGFIGFLYILIAAETPPPRKEIDSKNFFKKGSELERKLKSDNKSIPSS